MKPRVTIKPEIEGVVPFIIYSYSYTPELLNNVDVDKIYNSILHWINGNAEIYVDLHKGTSKAAYPQQKTSKIKIKENCNKNMNRNRENVVRLTESKLRNMIRESIKTILNASYYWGGDTGPLERIISACDKIFDNFKGLMQDDAYDHEGGMGAFDLFEWVQKVRSEAEKFYNCNTNHFPVGYGDLGGY